MGKLRFPFKTGLARGLTVRPEPCRRVSYCASAVIVKPTFCWEVATVAVGA